METMKLQLLGSFSLSWSKGTIREGNFRSQRLTSLLAFLLFKRNEIVTLKQLKEMLPTDKGQNPDGILRNLVYRLRTELKALGEEEFICTKQGRLSENPPYRGSD